MTERIHVPPATELDLVAASKERKKAKRKAANRKRVVREMNSIAKHTPNSNYSNAADNARKIQQLAQAIHLLLTENSSG